MRNLTGNEIRTAFLNFFQDRGHLIQPSASLIPENDPTLLLIGAGMAPFKPFFTGKVKPPSTRITTCQKCVRTGDIENVGKTARHHTFFEMLGNFSFGDYFKEDAIKWSWEFLTVILAIPGEKLWVTVYPDDDEAYNIWRDVIGVPAERIVRLEENFWEIGSGPCGPCSEIHVDLGEDAGCGKPDCTVGCDCDRFLEIWNLVFTQFNKNDDGTYTPLASKNIDTGAGLERLASVIQGKKSNFETDLIYPIIEYAAGQARLSYGQDKQQDVSLKVIADHARSLTVMIADGVLPTNEGRGYVLRRILRRAVRHGRLLGIEHPFLAGAVDAVISIFAGVYPELVEKADYIKRIITMEEERFSLTLNQGTELLHEEIAQLKSAGKTGLSGLTAFKLYDTFGFPWELTAEILEENGMTVDNKDFEKAMREQRERARAARGEGNALPVIYDTASLDIRNIRDDEEIYQANVMLLFRRESAQTVQTATDGEAIALVLSVNPFHPEGGGQVADSGELRLETGIVDVTGAKKLPDGISIIFGFVREGFITVGDEAEAIVDFARKKDIARNHTATHLLQAALKKVLGEHVAQAGSYVGPDRLRFDFSHFEAITPEELREVEQLVNMEIFHDVEVDFQETDIATAKAMGATALFGEKYGETVRVVTVPGFSMELCGGVHVKNTSEIGIFKIISESSVGAGLRRIEAVTGRGALLFLHELEKELNYAAFLLKTRPQEVAVKVNALLEDLKEAENKVASLNARLLDADTASYLKSPRIVGDIKTLVLATDVTNIENLRAMGDKIRDKLDGVVVILATDKEEKVQILAMATKAAVAKGIHCGELVRQTAAVLNGKGGGRPEMAQGGGHGNRELAEKAVKTAERLIDQQLNGK